MAPTVAPKASCIIRAWNNTTRHAARVTVCPLVPCRGQGRSAMAGGTRHIGFYYAATRARMTPAVAAKDACTRGAMGTTVRCPPVVPGPLARGSHCPPCPRPWKPPWFPMLAGGPQFRPSPFDTSAFAVFTENSKCPNVRFWGNFGRFCGGISCRLQGSTSCNRSHPATARHV